MNLLARQVSVEGVVPVIEHVLSYTAEMLGAKEIRLAHTPSVTTINAIQLEMGPLTKWLATKTWLDGGGTQIIFRSDATSKGGVDYMASGIDVKDKSGNTVTFVLGWDSPPNHTVQRQLELC
jgi:hypothetical protein